MSDPVRWGILGAAKFAREQMGPAIHMARGGMLAGLATRSAEKAAPFSDMAPGLRVFDDYDALIADPGIDAVYIPLPNHLHVEWAKKAAQAGKHVLCEKPISLAASEIDELIALRDQTGLLVAEAYMIVHHPQWQKAREMVQAGEVGELKQASVSFSFNNPDLENIRNDPERGGGALRDIGVYAFGGVRFVTGKEPSEILSSRIDWEHGIDATTYVTAKFPSFMYTGHVSMRASPFQQVVFHGTEGVLRLPVPFNALSYGQAEVILQKEHHVQSWRFPGTNQYVRQVEAFNASMADPASYPCTLEFVRGTQAMIDEVYAAAP